MLEPNFSILETNTPNTEETEWEMPISLDEQPLPDFPKGMFCEWIEEMIDGLSEEYQAPRDAVGNIMIGMFSTALTKKFRVRPKYHHNESRWTVDLNTYVFVYMPPGSKKSDIFKVSSKPIRDFEKEEKERLTSEIAKHNADLDVRKRRIEVIKNEMAKGEKKNQSEYERLVEEVSRIEPRHLPEVIAENSTAEALETKMVENNSKIAVLSPDGQDILQIMSGRYSGQPNIGIYLKSYNDDSIKTTRMTRNLIISKPRMTLCLMLQVDIAKKYDQYMHETGFTQRILHSFPKNFIGHRNVRALPLKKEIEETYYKNMIKMLKMLDDENELTFDKESMELLFELEKTIEKMLGENGRFSSSDNFKEWGQKLLERIVKYAGLIHVTDNIKSTGIPEVVNADTFKRACFMVDYSISHAEKAFGLMERNVEADNLEYILKRIKDRYNKSHNLVLSHSQLKDDIKKFKSNEIKELTLILEEMGYLRIGYEGKKLIYEINPLWVIANGS
ncbi:DUF3987 domain-containing protein [Arthrobacter citreus]|nr:DUF3987 domain-containing protein [Arthrobacter citreus]